MILLAFKRPIKSSILKHDKIPETRLCCKQSIGLERMFYKHDGCYLRLF